MSTARVDDSATRTWTGGSARKHDAILAAADTVFLRNGYLAANLDEVAEIAAVSKRTVYKHFTDKDTLFTEVLMAAIGPMDGVIRDALGTLGKTGDLDTDLRALARTLIAVVVTPAVMQLRRIVITEAARFPAVAAAWLEQGPGRNIATLAEYVRDLTDRGELTCGDPRVAAEHFNWLVLGGPTNRCMFDPTASYTRDELHRMADQAVEVFLAAYRGTSG